MDGNDGLNARIVLDSLDELNLHKTCGAEEDCLLCAGKAPRSPATIVGGMNRQPKAGAQMKKVAPPQVPETAFRHSGSSFGSAGYGSAGEEPVFHDAPVRDGYDMTDCYGPPGKSPGSQFSYPQFTFPGQPYIHINAAKATAHYHQLALQEDQGIDMTQSPGRDSPGSSGSRHSTASLDSGRASSSGSHLTGPGSGSLHHPRCSISSSSVGSTESGASARVERLLMQGVPDHDVLHSWLMDLHFEEYFPLFIAAGYDMSTISRMTPEDLTAIGIKKPNHRKKLKAEIAQLTISDGLPDYIPGSLDEWLRLLRLEEYGPALGCQGYETIQDVTQLTWEDLEDIGIVKLGHQKRLMLAIKRVKDLKAGKVFPPGNTGIYGNTIHIQATVESPSNGMLANNMPNIMPDCSIECPRVHTTFKSFHQPWEIEATRNMYCTTDIIPIQIRGGRGKSLESLEDGMNNQRSLGGGTSSFTQLPAAGWRRSYDDGDITPTNESILVPMHEGGGTLPRPKGLVRPRPIAKIPATFVPTYRNEEICLSTLKRRPPSPPKRQNESVTVVADLHCAPYPPPPAPMSPITTNYSCLTPSFKANGSDASFKSVSSTESDSIPFANENAGTIKQRSSRPGADYAPTIELQSKERSSSLSSSRKLEQEPSDVLNDIGNMLANLTDELDAMLEEEKRQNLAEV
nr:PREDICTED: caskin-2 isoform X2 [Bemisia tabaci]